MFLNRMGRAQAEIERRNFQSTVMAMQAAVLLQSVVRHEDVAPGDDPALVYREQFGLLPTGYVGRLDRPDPAAVAGGEWYFDTGKRQTGSTGCVAYAISGPTCRDRHGCGWKWSEKAVPAD